MKPESDPIPRSPAAPTGSEASAAGLDGGARPATAWRDWPAQFLAFLRDEPLWLWLPLALVTTLLIVLILFGPGPDASFQYALF
jgi:hypothetical protein